MASTDKGGRKNRPAPKPSMNPAAVSAGAKVQPSAAAVTKPPRKPKGESRIGKAFKTFRNRMFTLFFSLVLILAAVFAGAYVTYQVQRDIWEQKIHHENRQALVDMRVDLIERSVKMMSKTLVISESAKVSRTSTLSSLAKLGLDPSSIVDVISKNLDKQTLAKCRFLEKHNEYITLLTLDATFFGDSTRAVTRKLMKLKPWWGANAKQRNALIQALDYDFIMGYGTTDR